MTEVVVETNDRIRVYWNAAHSCQWVDLMNPTAEDFAALQREGLRLDDDLLALLTSEDERPELHRSDGEHISFVFHAIAITRDPLDLAPHEIELVVGKDYLITIHTSAEIAIFNELQAIWQSASTAYTDGPAVFLFHRVVKTVVDHYHDVLDELQDDLFDIERRVVSDPRGSGELQRTQDVIFTFSKALRDLRKYLGPLRRALDQICELTQAAPDHLPFPMKHSWLEFRDVRLQVEHQIELVDSYRDMVTNVLGAYQSTVSNQLAELSNTLNRSMQWLTVAATILTTASFIVGFYGMNLTGWGLNSSWPHGATLVLFIVILVGALEYLVFKWKKLI